MVYLYNENATLKTKVKALERLNLKGNVLIIQLQRENNELHERSRPDQPINDRSTLPAIQRKKTINRRAPTPKPKPEAKSRGYSPLQNYQ